jgi:hypothetical protein
MLFSISPEHTEFHLGSLTELMDHLTEFYSAGNFYTEIQKAKSEFFLKAGKIYEDDFEFESRMNIFTDWYLFERDLQGYDLPPINHALRDEIIAFSEKEKRYIEELRSTVHSIFQVLKVHPEEMLVKDLFSKKKIKLHTMPTTPLLSKSDIFEGRTLPHQGNHFLSNGICIHPVAAKRFITKKIKQLRYRDRGRQKEFILELADMKLKHTRFHHIDIKYIYTDHPTQKFLHHRRAKGSKSSR